MLTMHPYECDLVNKKTTRQCRPLENVLPEMESTMDWYDHVAFAFLAYPSPGMALQKMKAVITNHQQGKPWQDLVISPFFKEQLKENCETTPQLFIEILQVLQQNKLLNYLDVFERKDSAYFIDQFRLELFKLIDQLNAEQVKKFIEEMNAQIGKEQDHIYPCLEMHILEWIDHKMISSDNRSKLNRCLEVVGLKCPSLAPTSGGLDVYQTPNPASMQPLGIQTFAINKGLCVIINQMKFDQFPYFPTDMKPLEFRFGSDVDRDNLAETFRLLSHDVEIHENLTRQQILDTFFAISRKDFTRYDALTICILSHGVRGCIMSSDSTPIELDKIKNTYFSSDRCPLLAAKPKLFFIQACQVDAFESGGKLSEDSYHRNRMFYTFASTDSVNIGGYAQDGPVVRQPAISNFLEAWATVPGFVSFRCCRGGKASPKVRLGTTCFTL